MTRALSNRGLFAAAAALTSALIAIPIAAPDSASGQAPRPSEERRPRSAVEVAHTMVLTPRRRADLAQIEIEISDPRLTRAPRLAVTDLAVVLEPGRGDLPGALGGSGGTGVAAERRLIRARLLVVAGGRLRRGPESWCGGFDRGRSVCTVDCDGGAFALLRPASAPGPRPGRPGADDATPLALSIGSAGDADEPGDDTSVTLDACRSEAEAPARLVTRGGLRRSEIPLAED